MYDVFISYRREGGVEFARMLFERFKNVDLLNAFFDYEELRDGRFNEKLYDAIENSKNFIIVLSPNALDRCIADGDWVKKELLHAH